METAANISVSRNRMKGPISFRVKKMAIRRDPVIFLVDDDPLYLQALELAISSENGKAKIYTFQTASSCLNNLKLKPDVVILDYYLDSVYPNSKNGIEVLKEIRRMEPRTKVIMLSAQDSLNIAIDSMENGAYDYISKSQSSFIRVNNLLTNILGDKENSSLFFRVLQVIILIILLVLIAGALINQ
ncbi:MAG: response regulator transcription factor [Bacteroidia bacterium]